jgi:hypothetical protein
MVNETLTSRPLQIDCRAGLKDKMAVDALGLGACCSRGLAQSKCPYPSQPPCHSSVTARVSFSAV